MEAFLGTWTLKTNENLPAFLHALGLPKLISKIAEFGTTVMTFSITETEGQYQIKIQTTVKTIKAKFTLGDEFEEKSIGGTDLKVGL